MRAVTATANVGPDHTLTLQVPADILPGTHHVVVVLQEETEQLPRKPFLADWPAAHDTGPST